MCRAGDGLGLVRSCDQDPALALSRLSCACHRRWIYESAMPIGRLVRQVSDKSQVCTQRSWKRPFGVGLLVAGVDQKGPHLFNTCPSGNYYEYKAMAMGGRAQVSVKTGT